jgi:hypothetical protein
MVDFYKRALDLLFKQSPVIVLAVVGLYLLWQRLERIEVQRVAERIEIRKECAEAIAEIRGDLAVCNSRNEALKDENTRLAVEVSGLKATVGLLGRTVRGLRAQR